MIDCIENGYHLPLKLLPPPFSQCNHRSAIDNLIFVNKAVKELVANHCACVVSDKPYICNPLSVVSSAMGFKWDDNDEVCYFVFTVLLFGLSTACYCFTKLMKPLGRFWRGRG